MNSKFVYPNYNNRYRPIQVSVEEDAIVFTFPEEDNREFYWIPKDQWISDFSTTRQEEHREDNWHRHMPHKTWFVQEMYDFINKACGLPEKTIQKEEPIEFQTDENGFIKLSDIFDQMFEKRFKK